MPGPNKIDVLVLAKRVDDCLINVALSILLNGMYCTINRLQNHTVTEVSSRDASV